MNSNCVISNYANSNCVISNYVNSNCVAPNYVTIGSSDWNYSICYSTGFVVAAPCFDAVAIVALSLLWAATEI